MKRNNPHKFIVINADDFGLCPSTNKAIIVAHTNGILTSTSLLVTCPGFQDAVKKIKENKKLGIGIHLSLTLGKSVLPAKTIPKLVDTRRLFYPGYKRLLLGENDSMRSQIKLELEAQIKKVMKLGIKLDHIDSQEHVHMIPYIYKIVVSLAEKYNIPFVRLSKDKVVISKNAKANILPLINKNIVKLVLLNSLALRNARHRSKIVKPVTFFGVYNTGYMSKQVIYEILHSVKPGVTEILTHPGYSLNDTNFDFKLQKMYNFMTNINRRNELTVLLDKTLKKEIENESIKLTTFRKAVKASFDI